MQKERGSTAQTRSDEVFYTLRNKIISRQLTPGMPVNEREIASELQVSRTPVREAIRRLSEQGYVAIEANKSARVKSLSVDDLNDVYDVRIPLEGYAALIANKYIGMEDIRQLAALNEQMRMVAREGQYEQFEKFNQEFHYTLYGFCQNEWLLSLIQKYWEHSSWYRTIVFSSNGRADAIVQEHEFILMHLTNRDGESVERAIRIHLINAKEAFSVAVQGLRSTL